ncbi:MAG: sulfatase [Planctomycetota bacterium]
MSSQHNGDRANILIIQCDQLSQQAVSVYGNEHVQTPNMDALAEQGVRFEQVYTPCPLCRPARAAMWTSRWPHETGVVGNGDGADQIPDEFPTLGEQLTAAGYEAVHFGKQHDAGGLRGFEVVPDEPGAFDEDPGIFVNGDSLRDRDTVPKAVEYLSTPPGEKPRLTIVDLQNPHNICGWIGQNQGPQGTEEDDSLPPLPENFEIKDLASRPLPIQYLCCGHRRLAHGSNWSEADYRRYLAAYYRYTEMADEDVGRVLEALHSTAAGENTIVILLADHGEGMGRHRMITKQVSFYEETNRVPLIVAGPGVQGDGRSENRPLVTLLDLMPTVCELAGAKRPEEIRGLSLAPWLRGEQGASHEYIAGEWYTEFGHIVTPGRMIRTHRYKYTRYLEGDGEELYDLQTDPGETRNLAPDADFADVLDAHRELLCRHLRATDDPFAELGVEADARWRSHPVGYANHEGPNVIEWSRQQAQS